MASQDGVLSYEDHILKEKQAVSNYIKKYGPLRISNDSQDEVKEEGSKQRPLDEHPEEENMQEMPHKVKPLESMMQ